MTRREFTIWALVAIVLLYLIGSQYNFYSNFLSWKFNSNLVQKIAGIVFIFVAIVVAWAMFTGRVLAERMTLAVILFFLIICLLINAF